jgi:hypothetical protein
MSTNKSGRQDVDPRELARRYRVGIARQAQGDREGGDEAIRRLLDLGAERKKLFDTLQAFALAVGIFEVVRDPAGLTISFGGKVIRFEAMGEAGRVRVIGDNLYGEHRLYFQELLEKWIWIYPDRLRREQQKVLFNAGLEELLALSLEVQPAAADDPAVTREPLPEIPDPPEAAPFDVSAGDGPTPGSAPEPPDEAPPPDDLPKRSL